MKTLSSGLKKIIMIIQAFVAPYDIIVADEPTANLDFETRMNFYKLVTEENKKGKTFLISTHDLLEVRHFANHYIHIKDGKLLKTTKKFSFNSKAMACR
jgi:ABC-2 type transport system ATP-binding protein